MTAGALLQSNHIINYITKLVKPSAGIQSRRVQQRRGDEVSQTDHAFGASMTESEGSMHDQDGRHEHLR